MFSLSYSTALLLGASATALFSPIIILLYTAHVRTSAVPADIPWAGLKSKKYFAKLRACLREFGAKRSPYDEGYISYTKKGLSFVLPSLFYPEVALPPSNLAWLASQPENVLSNGQYLDEMLSLRALGYGPSLEAVMDFGVLRKDLTRNLARVLDGVMEEMKLAFEEELAAITAAEDTSDEQDGGWKEVKMFKVIETVSRRFNNCLFVGLPLCRDERYIAGIRRWEMAFGVYGSVMRYLIPPALHAWMAPVLGIPVRVLGWRLKRLLKPVIRDRLLQASRPFRVGSDDKGTADAPTDVLQYLLNTHLEGKDAPGMSLGDIAAKAILLNFFSVHTISLNFSLLLTNLLLTPEPTQTPLLASLRDEAALIIPQLRKNPHAIRSMPRTDSAIRESLRHSSMTGRGLSRVVASPAGTTTPDGLFLSQGMHVCVVVSSMHSDPDVWEDGHEFRPMRFYRPVPQVSADGEEEGEGKVEKHAVHVTEDFLAFGLGRHACPGRFFAVQALKLMLGHLLTTYDFAPLTERPKILEIGEVIAPNDKATIKLRRRRRDQHDHEHDNEYDDERELT